MKILMVRLDSDCETKIHYELKLDEVIKSIQTNDSNEVNTDRGVHSTQTVGDTVLRRTTAKIMERLQTERNATQIEDSYSYARTKV